MRPVDLSAFIERLAQVSGEAILPFFRTQLSVVDKGDGRFDPVTEADRAAETVIRRHIRTAFPTHGVLGEEFEAELPDAEYLWVIDPIEEADVAARRDDSATPVAEAVAVGNQRDCRIRQQVIRHQHVIHSRVMNVERQDLRCWLRAFIDDFIADTDFHSRLLAVGKLMEKG